MTHYVKTKPSILLTPTPNICLCFYNIALWRNYTVTCLNRFKASYHKSVKKFLALQELIIIIIIIKSERHDNIIV